MNFEYDVVIAGASFAGLAAANALKGRRVLLVDRYPVGARQTSACGTPLQTLRYWQGDEAVLRVHQALVLHTPQGEYAFPSPYPWCTFDYEHFCQILYRHSGAEFLQAGITGFDGKTLTTTAGPIRGRAFIDATGWRAVLASALQPEYRHTLRANQGLESIVEMPAAPLDPNALHFWYTPDILRHGVGWAFPRGETVSLGVGAYNRGTHLKPALNALLTRFGVQENSLHGAYFPFALRKAVVQNVFLAGDSAGMCLGLTGEGIRPALFFGEACGRILRRSLERDDDLAAAAQAYRAFVQRYERLFRVFALAQETLHRMPYAAISLLAAFLGRPILRRWLLMTYWRWTHTWNETTFRSLTYD